MGEVQDEGRNGMLVRLPNELLLLIFTHVRGRHLVKNVRLVCRKFHSLLDNPQWWLSRIHKMPQGIRLSESHMNTEDFDAARSFIAIEEETQRWSKWAVSKNVIATGHIATVDALRLFAHRASANRFCLSGGRDRAIKLWDIKDLQDCQSTSTATKPCVDIQNAHEGWIWCLDQSTIAPEQFLSCSWDCTVKLWQVTPTSVEPLESTKLGSAGMCLSNSPSGLAACSTFGKKVFVVDTRNGLAPVLNYAHHKGAVLTLVMRVRKMSACSGNAYLYEQDNVVYSCGEDRRVVMVDIRNSSKPALGLWANDYVRSICFRDNQLICGTNLGMITVLNPENLSICSRLQVSTGVRQVIHSGGAILEISRDRTFKVFLLLTCFFFVPFSNVDFSFLVLFL
ncbi:F-box domain protein [Oesophagostomum dentatum]|uniref:F-box domain protein n=1 Tax=Oesophagostomum dentatum TaxID=61180 RepID=A0A0B1SQ25_OESDE|nr:F-box domain protein [Oesophagostomum dentatum]